MAHAEVMPLAELPRLGAGLAEVERQRRDQGRSDGWRTWETWWDEATRDPALQTAAAQRRAVFETDYPTEEFSPPADWHIATLGDSGFAEVGVVWRSGTSAVVAAVR